MVSIIEKENSKIDSDEGESCSFDVAERTKSSSNSNNNNTINSIIKRRKQKKTKINNSTDETVVIAKAETNIVRRLKLFVVLLLIALTIGVAYAVYSFSSQTETTKFEEQFSNDAGLVLESVARKVEDTLSLVDIFATTILSYASYNNHTWPYVTYPYYAQNAAKVRSSSDGIALFLNPIVTTEERIQWEKYSIDNGYWVNETMNVMSTDENYYGPIFYNFTEPSQQIFGDFDVIPYNVSRLLVPQWQSYPTTPRLEPAFNWDWLSPTNPESVYACIGKQKAVLSEPYMLPNLTDPVEVEEHEYWVEYYSDLIRPDQRSDEPLSDLVYPLIDTVDATRTDNTNRPKVPKVVAILVTHLYWRDLMTNILPDDRASVVLVFHNPCAPTFTYQVIGPNVIYLGRGDQHDDRYNHMILSRSFFALKKGKILSSRYSGALLDEEFCPMTIDIYPTDEMESAYTTNNPLVFTIAAVAIFVFTTIAFGIYDFTVERRQNVVLTTAVRSSAIVSSLFPTKVRDRMLRSNDNNVNIGPPNTNDTGRPSLSTHRTASMGNFSHKSSSMKSIGVDDDDDVKILESKPLADLYPETTVCFADLAGFTAWSSERDPTQVFTLLETIFGAFDKIASKRRVFKVETIGDAYLTVVGLPEQRRHHAIIMCKFAADCMDKMAAITSKLDSILGPCTSDLKLRVGIHSGPTTAGVLRGDKSRFQLFGDTVNTASRIETTSIPGRIQVSQKTADLLTASGKKTWIVPREDQVEAKGKGRMQTYWLTLNCNSTVQESEKSTNDHEQSSSSLDVDCQSTAVTIRRLIEWNVDLCKGILKQIISHRAKLNVTSTYDPNTFLTKPRNCNPIQEYKEVINFRKYDHQLQIMDSDNDCDTELMQPELDEKVTIQLHDYISTLAYTYKNNPFHNFEHASHVVMSTLKLLQRIHIPDREQESEESPNSWMASYTLLDPLTKFAIIFSALIHDVDHSGMSNDDIVRSGSSLALLYDRKSVSQQNSFDIAWNLLTQPRYIDLNRCIYQTEEEYKHFRQVVINSVMSTDLFDPDLNAMRNRRWDEAFCESPVGESVRLLNCESDDHTNDMRKATIVIETVLQVSDVVHTMQHWRIYQKWNHRFFHELHVSHRRGETGEDPSDDWFTRELRFFDNVIIPLGKKLRLCGFFGSFCDEYLDYAMDNRLEWEGKGQQIVQDLASQAKSSAEAE